MAMIKNRYEVRLRGRSGIYDIYDLDTGRIADEPDCSYYLSREPCRERCSVLNLYHRDRVKAARELAKTTAK